MTSTRFNIGLGEATKNSSKVLKPPGGGSSDIFGATDSAEQSPRRRNTNHLQSSMFVASDMTEPPVTPRNKPDGNPVTGEGYSAMNGEKDGASPPAITVASAEARRNNRVPPGGFSSGLW